MRTALLSASDTCRKLRVFGWLEGMRIGYSMWGFLCDGVTDTPDGSRSYRRPFVVGLREAGQEIVFLQQNRDLDEAGADLRGQYRWHYGFPDLDALIFEWRWPLPGRNTTLCGTAGHTCDLHRQTELFDYYTRRGMPTLLWDLDRQLVAGDPRRQLPNLTVGEFALMANPGATRLVCPVPDAQLDGADPVRLAALPRTMPLVYVGNQYDRDAAFGRYFAPAARMVRHQVAGEWPRTESWPHVNFTGRCSFSQVAQIHEQALATVLLLPERYAAVSHMTSRWFEALLAGCLPLIPAEVRGADAYVPHSLLVADGQDVIHKLEWLQGIVGTSEHADLIAACLSYLEPFRCSTQVAVAIKTLEALT